MNATDEARAEHRTLILGAYAAYNTRDVEGLLALVSDQVDWPDDHGGRLHGKAQVRTYWMQQWAHTHTHDEPTAISEMDDNGRTVVEISQVVRSLDGCVIDRGRYVHRHRIVGDRIARMDIETRPTD